MNAVDEGDQMTRGQQRSVLSNARRGTRDIWGLGLGYFLEGLASECSQAL